MHSHEFIQSTKKDVFFCKACSKISYKGIISQTLPIRCLNIFNNDPLKLKFRPISTTVNYKSANHLNYLEIKNQIISKIKYLCNNFGLKSMILHKSINFINQIFLQNEISINNIDNISSVCVLLVTEFNECCIPSIFEEYYTKSENDILFNSFLRKNNIPLNQVINNKVNEKTIEHKSNLRGLINYIKNNIKDFKYWEILCLNYLNYDLGRYSTYDYLILFFRLGIFFCKEEINILDKLNFCFKILEILINDKRSCNFSQYIFAMSIIKITLEKDNFFDKKIFKYIYGVDLSKGKYEKCSNLIKDILITYINNDYVKNTLNILNYLLISNQLNNNQQIYNNKYNQNTNIPEKQNMYINMGKNKINKKEAKKNNNNNKEEEKIEQANINDKINYLNNNNLEKNGQSKSNNNYIIIYNNITNKNTYNNNLNLQQYNQTNNNTIGNNYFFFNFKNPIYCCNESFQ